MTRQTAVLIDGHTPTLNMDLTIAFEPLYVRKDAVGWRFDMNGDLVQIVDGESVIEREDI